MVRSLDKKYIKEIDVKDLPEPYDILAQRIGVENMLKVAEIFDGEYVYFHKVEAILRPIRNKKIREEFNGYNYNELAKKYGLTEIMIRTICQDIIKKHRNRPIDGQISILG